MKVIHIFLIISTIFVKIFAQPTTITVKKEDCNFGKIIAAIKAAPVLANVVLQCDPGTKIIWEQEVYIEKSIFLYGPELATSSRVTLDAQNKNRFFVVSNTDISNGVIAGNKNERITFYLFNFNLVNGASTDLKVGRRPGCLTEANCTEPVSRNSDGSLLNPVIKRDGGCIYVGAWAHVTLGFIRFESCRAEGNTVEGAIALNDQTAHGGAIYYSTSVYAEIKSSQFVNCYSKQDGGAIFANSFNNTKGQINILTSVFASNTAEENGGAISSNMNLFSVTDSVFYKNKAKNGGAFYGNFSTFTGYNNYFEQNSASKSGGAIYFNGLENPNLNAYSDAFSFSNSHFYNNTARIVGGGIYFCNKNLSIVNLKFENDNFCGNSIRTGNANWDPVALGAVFQYDCYSSSQYTQFMLMNVSMYNNTITLSNGTTTSSSSSVFNKVNPSADIITNYAYIAIPGQFYGNNTGNNGSQANYAQLVVYGNNSVITSSNECGSNQLKFQNFESFIDRYSGFTNFIQQRSSGQRTVLFSFSLMILLFTLILF